MNDPNEAVLLTEDGYPIGELVISDGGASVPSPADNAVVESREQLLRTQAAELTGQPDADRAVAELYPGYGDSDKRRSAMNMFVVEQKSVDEIAKLVEVPGRTVSMWVYNGNWSELVKKELMARQSLSILEMARLRADRRNEVMKEQLDQAKELRDTAIRKLREGETSVKSATEAWAAASKIEHTVTGLSEAGELASLDGESKQAKSDAKPPLVVVFNNGSASGIPTLGGRK